jgi:hypothetical protein
MALGSMVHVQPAPAASRRLRTRLFPQRQPLLFRVSPSLYGSIVAVSDAMQVSITVYVSTVLELALAAETDILAARSFHDGRYDEKVSVTLRLTPSLALALKKRAKTCQVPSTRLMAYCLYNAIAAGKKLA